MSGAESFRRGRVYVHRPATALEAADHASVELVASGPGFETPGNDEHDRVGIRSHPSILRLSYRTIQSSRVGLPSDRLPADALASAMAGFVAVTGFALLSRAAQPLSGWYPIKSAGVFAVVMLVALGHLRTHYPFARFGSAKPAHRARARDLSRCSRAWLANPHCRRSPRPPQ